MNRYVRQIPGVLGLLLIITALLMAPRVSQPWYFFVGSVLMGVTALLEWHTFFIGLEIIVVTGTILGCLTFDWLVSVTILATSTIGVLIWFLRTRLIHDTIDLFGFVGMCVLAYSYAVISTWGFFISGLLLSAYSFLDLRRGSSVAMLWLVLNGCFAIAGAVALYRQ